MNYSRNLRRAAIAKRVIISWLIIAMLFSLFGFGIGYSVKGHKVKETVQEQEETIEATNEIKVFGGYDERCITSEISLDWESGNLNFTPLDVDMNEDLQKFVFYLSAGYNLDFTLVMALIQHESSFKSNVISKSDDYGLMQINACNHEYITETIGVTDFLDPYQNVRAGTFILRKLFEKYQDTDMVLMAYNMGEDGAARLWKQGIYETNYTQSILNYQKQFNKQLDGK